MGNVATVEVFVDGVQIGLAQNPQKKMAQKLAARNALVILKEKAQHQEEEAKAATAENGKSKTTPFTRQTLNDLCLRRQWPMPQYKYVRIDFLPHVAVFAWMTDVSLFVNLDKF